MQAIAQEELRRWQLEALFHAYTGEKEEQRRILKTFTHAFRTRDANAHAYVLLCAARLQRDTPPVEFLWIVIPYGIHIGWVHRHLLK